ncbi:hypothetical protein [Paenibacillus roseipurpureus]|uniref:Uncharacterized protein n=1 Tax=Paenibacillus roseopurpureus TaxID=2918901 RepID=A0AA96LTB7_9BACL|nr:hypothetical protein [Paenibacillus sp. MBLB1832]WNR46904.1 hypothetical protein MJB10_12690 [Paenibacillus sp. MBLB1832]
MKKLFTLVFTVILICNLGINFYQYKRLVHSYNVVADKFIFQLDKAKQSAEGIQKTIDESQLSLYADDLWYAPDHIADYGSLLDSMVQNSTSYKSILSHVGTDLANFTLDVWSKNGLKQPIRSGNNPLPSPVDTAKLKEVYTIFRNHFTDSIIRHTDYEKQRQALLDAHQEIKSKGLDQLLKNPTMFDMGM